MSVLVTVVNNQNKLAVSKLLILNGKNIISWVNEMICEVNYDIRAINREYTIKLMKDKYEQIKNIE